MGKMKSTKVCNMYDGCISNSTHLLGEFAKYCKHDTELIIGNIVPYEILQSTSISVSSIANMDDSEERTEASILLEINVLTYVLQNKIKSSLNVLLFISSTISEAVNNRKQSSAMNFLSVRTNFTL